MVASCLISAARQRSQHTARNVAHRPSVLRHSLKAPPRRMISATPKTKAKQEIVIPKTSKRVPLKRHDAPVISRIGCGGRVLTVRPPELVARIQQAVLNEEQERPNFLPQCDVKPASILKQAAHSAGVFKKRIRTPVRPSTKFLKSLHASHPALKMTYEDCLQEVSDYFRSIHQIARHDEEDQYMYDDDNHLTSVKRNSTTAELGELPMSFFDKLRCSHRRKLDLEEIRKDRIAERKKKCIQRQRRRQSPTWKTPAWKQREQYERLLRRSAQKSNGGGCAGVESGNDCQHRNIFDKASAPQQQLYDDVRRPWSEISSQQMIHQDIMMGSDEMAAPITSSNRMTEEGTWDNNQTAPLDHSKEMDIDDWEGKEIWCDPPSPTMSCDEAETCLQDLNPLKEIDLSAVHMRDMWPDHTLNHLNASSPKIKYIHEESPVADPIFDMFRESDKSLNHPTISNSRLRTSQCLGPNYSKATIFQQPFSILRPSNTLPIASAVPSRSTSIDTNSPVADPIFDMFKGPSITPMRPPTISHAVSGTPRPVEFQNLPMNSGRFPAPKLQYIPAMNRFRLDSMTTTPNALHCGASPVASSLFDMFKDPSSAKQPPHAATHIMSNVSSACRKLPLPQFRLFGGPPSMTKPKVSTPIIHPCQEATIQPSSDDIAALLAEEREKATAIYRKYLQ